MTSRFMLPFAVLAVGAWTLTSSLPAQLPPATFNGAAPGDRFGICARPCGDVDRDGRPDVIVGADYADVAAVNAGSARVVSGLTGATIHTFHGDAAEDRFGFSVAGAGDVNGDGWPDLVAGAYNCDSNGADAGRVRVISGLGGIVMFTFNGWAAGDNLGIAVAGVGDVNGDGRPDIAAGASGADQGANNAGRVRVWSGATGQTIFTWDGTEASAGFGRDIAAAGDVNADGRPDVIVGEPWANTAGANAGRVRVYSGATGQLLHTFNGQQAGEYLGQSVAGAGDVDGDGYDDLAAGAPYNDLGGTDAGIVRVFSGRTGALLHTFIGPAAGASFGYSVAGAGDFNLDGFADVIAGAHNDAVNGIGSGSARIFSGRDGSVLRVLVGGGPDQTFGRCVAAAGDLNQDQIPDVLVGAPGAQSSTTLAGSVRIEFGVCPGQGQANRAAARLEINDAGLGTCHGPFPVAVPSAGGVLTLAWAGPPNAALLLFAGTANAAGAAIPGIGSLDIGTPPFYSDLVLIFDGLQPGFPNLLFRLDGTGNAQQSFSVPWVTPGPLINLQGVVVPISGPSLAPALTAAFFVAAS